MDYLKEPAVFSICIYQEKEESCKGEVKGNKETPAGILYRRRSVRDVRKRRKDIERMSTALHLPHRLCFILAIGLFYDTLNSEFATRDFKGKVSSCNDYENMVICHDKNYTRLLILLMVS